MGGGHKQEAFPPSCEGSFAFLSLRGIDKALFLFHFIYFFSSRRGPEALERERETERIVEIDAQ